jgi:hypothetical protein
MLDEDTPRSARSIGYGSPRDDRFFTPRTVARSNSNSNSEGGTPRFETPRYLAGGYNSQSDADGEFQTPRTFEDRRADRKEIYPTLLSRNSAYESPRTAIDNQYMAQSKNYLPPTGGGYRPPAKEVYSNYGAKEVYPKGATYQTPAQYTQSPARTKPGSKAQYPEDVEEEEDNHHRYNSNNNSNNNHEEYHEEDPQAADDYDAIDLAAAGLSEKDVEDVFSYARHGRCEEIERLFAKGLPVDVRDHFGNTVLIIACQNGNKRVAKAVLRRGANINCRNHKGNTPLHYCYHCKFVFHRLCLCPFFTHFVPCIPIVDE